MSNKSSSKSEFVSKASEAVMGEPPVWFINSLDAIVPGFARLLIETEFGTSYHRSGLDLKTRELVLIASCAALAATGIEALKMRIPVALKAGATRMEVLEVIVQIGFSAGLSASFRALQAAAEVFAEIDGGNAL